MKISRQYVVILLLLPSCVLASTRSDIDALKIGQQEIQARMERIESSVQNKGLLEISQTVERMQIELRELRGLIEQQSYELEGLSKRQRELYLDIDRRLNDFQLQGSVNSASSPQLAESITKTNSGAPVLVQNAEKPVVEETDEERSSYKSAFESLREARYGQAIKAFTAFLAKYPKGKYADNAQYWLGEANYVSRDFKKALTEFNKVIENYPRSSKIPDAKLKIGYTYYELKQWDNARKILSGIVNDHANTSVAPLAEQRLQRLSQEGH